MITHIVMWKFKEGEKENRDKFLKALKALQEEIPQILSMRTEVAVGGEYDAVLMAQFKNLKDLETYQQDSRHKAVSALCKSIRTERASIDFEE